jgi:hypothetical protein
MCAYCTEGRLSFLCFRQTNLHAVERPLFKEELERIDRFLSQGTLVGPETDDPKKLMKLLNWKSNGIEQFIKDGMTLVR